MKDILEKGLVVDKILTNTENASSKRFPNLVWIDLEMTGLEPSKDTILEIASIVTNANLDVIAKGPDIVIQHPLASLEAMDEWCNEHHKKSGLWDDVLKSTHTLEYAISETINFLKPHITVGKSQLCGNSIWQDRRFLEKYMPELLDLFHYRMIDVSAIKSLTEFWYGDSAKFSKPDSKHRALDDIEESVEELKHYRSQVFK